MPSLRRLVADLKTLFSPPAAPPDKPPKPTEPDPAQSADLAYDVAQQALDRQLGAVDSIDGKINSAFASCSALLAILAAVLAIRPSRFHGGAVALFVIAIAIYVPVGSIAVAASWSQTWATGPNTRTIVARYRAGDSADIVQWKVVRALIYSLEDNNKKLSAKRAGLAVCVGLLGALAVVVVAGLAVVAA